MLPVKLKASPVDIIVVYTPTAEADDQEINSYYTSLDNTSTSYKSRKVTVLMGNFKVRSAQRKIAVWLDFMALTKGASKETYKSNFDPGLSS